jgi:predicted DCC family thiol-disulfide oxidoreductase YuxK
MSLRAVVSFLGLQLGWFASVLGAANGHAWIGPMVVLAALAGHVFARPRGARREEIALLAAAALIGFCVDTALLRAAVLSAADARVSPAWLVVLWPNLAAATGDAGALGWLSRRPLLGALVGAVGGPAAYRAASALGAIRLEGSELLALALIGTLWSGVLPTFLWLRVRAAERTIEAGSRLLAKQSDPETSSAERDPSVIETSVLAALPSYRRPRERTQPRGRTAMQARTVEVFYDGECPLCMREIAMLMRRDKRGRIQFTDIAAEGFDPVALGLDRATMMNKIHGRLPSGQIIQGVEVFRQLYAAVGFGWLVAASRAPGLSPLLDAAYHLFARHRLRLTGRCADGACSVPAAPRDRL